MGIGYPVPLSQCFESNKNNNFFKKMGIGLYFEKIN